MLNNDDIFNLKLAKTFSQKSTCLHRQVGCVVVDYKGINKSSGWNNSTIYNCQECGKCYKERFGVAKGGEYCWAMHAEQVAILRALKNDICLVGATLYCTHKPCSKCLKTIVEVGIKRIVYVEDYDDDFLNDIIQHSGILIEQCPKEVI